MPSSKNNFFIFLATALLLFSCSSREEIAVQHWTLIRSITEETLTDINFISADTGYVWGYADKNILLQSTDSGQTWNSILKNLPTTSLLTCFAATQNQTVYAARDTLFKSTDGGKNWMKVTSNLNGKSVRKLVFFTEVLGYAICADGIYKTTSAGADWVLQKESSLGYKDGVWLNADVAYISGGSVVERNGNQQITSYGLLAKTNDGGQTWTDFTKGSWIDNSQNFKNIEALSFINAAYGYIATTDGNLLRTTDGGNNWDTIRSLSGIASQLLYIDNQTGFALIGSRIFSLRGAGAILSEEYSSQHQPIKLLINPFSKRIFLVGKNGEIAFRK